MDQRAAGDGVLPRRGVPGGAAVKPQGEQEAINGVERQRLALDSAAGFAVLLEVAGQADDPLCVPARNLADSLAAQHPALAQMREDLLCRA